MKRIVLITGGSRGIGKSFASRFAGAGDIVIVNYVSDDVAAAAVLDEVRSVGGECAAVKADIRRAEDVDAMFGRIKKEYSRLDVLINNAGIKKDSLLIKMSPEDFDDAISVNLKGAFFCMKAAGKMMMPQKSGHIINVSSYIGLKGAAGQSNYAAAKAGMIALAKSAAKELGRSNVKVNTVLPGLILTEMGSANPPDFIEKVKQDNCLGRLSDLTEISDFTYELSLKNNISGQVFSLDSRVI